MLWSKLTSFKINESYVQYWLKSLMMIYTNSKSSQIHHQKKTKKKNWILSLLLYSQLINYLTVDPNGRRPGDRGRYRYLFSWWIYSTSRSSLEIRNALNLSASCRRVRWEFCRWLWQKNRGQLLHSTLLWWYISRKDTQIKTENILARLGIIWFIYSAAWLKKFFYIYHCIHFSFTVESW